MDKTENTWAAMILPVVAKVASFKFRRRYDRDELIADAISISWTDFLKAPPEATPSTIAGYAVRRVRARRMFKESVRSIDVAKQQRHAFVVLVELNDLANLRDNPADIAAVNLDSQSWQQTLNVYQRRVLKASLNGERTKDIAEQMGVTPGAISQMRRYLVDSYLLYCE